jgi:hypothetical protein
VRLYRETTTVRETLVPDHPGESILYAGSSSACAATVVVALGIGAAAVVWWPEIERAFRQASRRGAARRR